MGLNFIVYVGPYYCVDRKEIVNENELWEGLVETWDEILCNGRYGSKDDYIYMVPNRQLPGITRQLRFSKDRAKEIVDINVIAIVREMEALNQLAGEVRDWIEDTFNCIVYPDWGIIPEYC